MGVGNHVGATSAEGTSLRSAHTRRNVIKYCTYSTRPSSRMAPSSSENVTPPSLRMDRRSSAAHPPLRHASPKNFALGLDLRALRGHDWEDIYIPLPGFGSRKWLK